MLRDNLSWSTTICVLFCLLLLLSFLFLSLSGSQYVSLRAAIVSPFDTIQSKCIYAIAVRCICLSVDRSLIDWFSECFNQIPCSRVNPKNKTKLLFLFITFLFRANHSLSSKMNGKFCFLKYIASISSARCRARMHSNYEVCTSRLVIVKLLVTVRGRSKRRRRNTTKHRLTN